MKIKFSLLLAIGLLLNLGQVMAHALWIETEMSGKKGYEQEVKIYYGEYEEGMIEDVADWYSDVKDFKLWLVGPNGEKTELETAAAEDHFKAKFTPEMDGIYRLQISHSAKDLGGDYLYQFNTATQVCVGDSKAIELKGEKTDLALLLTTPAKKSLKKELEFKTFFKGSPKAEVKVAAVSPKGWTKEFESDENGELSIETPWKGQYIIEATYTQETSGEHHGAPYQFIWRCATQSIER
ncbi:DUF4198 domain-containing protein [Echinicola jeungdonensis]|uniref:DUF4198 domain-containing protein n=1 Tax=Echinicola jeungdonensis TaxID=709343 RepID=A0ABV5J2Q4_9BACT|nr:DUF4198 domain-containing protein [Echinicola jeungdonensis]MDN3671040.1 DUF4198 domain-containing protein [Echinicola jeungdonensis]